MLLERLYPHGYLLLCSPVKAVARLFALASTAAFWATVGRSAAHIFGGFLLSCALGVVCAALAARYRLLRRLLAPLAAAIKAVPVVSFIILTLVWMSADELPLFIAALMVFPVIYGNVLTGILETDRELLEMAWVFEVPGSRVLRGIYLPQVLPYFRTACSLALGLCWKSGAAAEVIGLSDGTIGERLQTAKVYYETADLFAWTLVIVLLSLAFEKLFLRGVDALVRRVGQ